MVLDSFQERLWISNYAGDKREKHGYEETERKDRAITLQRGKGGKKKHAAPRSSFKREKRPRESRNCNSATRARWDMTFSPGAARVQVDAATAWQTREQPRYGR